MKFLIFLLATFSSSRAITLTCNFTMSADLFNLPSKYSCWQPIFSNLDNNVVTAVNGTHMSGKTNNDVQIFYVNDFTSLTFYPRGLETFFPNLIAIDFDRTNISILAGDELDSFSDLKWFRIAFNPNLRNIPSDFFANNLLLETLFIYANGILSLGVNLLNNLSNLSFADFTLNNCTNNNAIATQPSQIANLIQKLRDDCPDDTTTTTTTTTTTSTTTISTTLPQEPSCGDLDEVVCEMLTENESLLEENVKINEDLEAKIDQMEALQASNSAIEAKLAQLKATVNNLTVVLCNPSSTTTI